MDWALLIKMGHIIGATLGVGGATVSDVLFFRSIRDRKISKDEISLLKGASFVIWTGLAILVLSGLGFLFLQYINTGAIAYLKSPKFQLKMTIVSLIFLNGLVFHFFVFPLLKKNAGKSLHTEKIHSKLWLLAMTGTLSIISWYIVLILGMLRKIPVSYTIGLEIYLIVIISGVIFAYFTLSHKLFPPKR